MCSTSGDGGLVTESWTRKLEVLTGVYSETLWRFEIPTLATVPSIKKDLKDLSIAGAHTITDVITIERHAKRDKTSCNITMTQ